MHITVRSSLVLSDCFYLIYWGRKGSGVTSKKANTKSMQELCQILIYENVIWLHERISAAHVYIKFVVCVVHKEHMRIIDNMASVE